MGQAFRHGDKEGATEAIWQLQRSGVPDAEIILGFMAELHSLSEDHVDDIEMETQDSKKS